MAGNALRTAVGNSIANAPSIAERWWGEGRLYDRHGQRKALYATAGTAGHFKAIRRSSVDTAVVPFSWLRRDDAAPDTAELEGMVPSVGE